MPQPATLLADRLCRPGRKTARTLEEVPTGYEGLEIVDHLREIDTPYSPRCLAVKIREDDVASWALHAWLRSQRTGLASRDEVTHMVAAARALHPERPGALDLPARDIGRRWCRPTEPDCPACPLAAACPRLIHRGSHVKGI